MVSVLRKCESLMRLLADGSKKTRMELALATIKPSSPRTPLAVTINYRLKVLLKLGLIEQLPDHRRVPKRKGRPPALYVITDDGRDWLTRRKK